MIAALIAIAVFLALAALMLHWAERDYATTGGLTLRSSVGLWLLYLLHADSVATAAHAGALRFGAVPQGSASAVGAAVGVVGLGLFVSAGVQLARTPEDRDCLVTTGSYRLMRHPQNTGWALVLLGIALAGRSVLALALVGIFAVFAVRYARVEEGHLERRFGQAWQRYRERTGPLPLARRRPQSART